MNCAREARKLADFIDNLKNTFIFYEAAKQFSYNHIGALFTDIILQAGVNYASVVKPRVQRVLVHYPEASTVSGLQHVVDRDGLEYILNWYHPIKLERMRRLIDFAWQNQICNCVDLKVYLLNSDNHKKLLNINGVGPKTLDYLLKLLDFDTVAVDRHIYSFVEMAEIQAKDYYFTKKVVEYAADFLQVSRSSLDYSIWRYMSDKVFIKERPDFQLKFEFA